MRKLLIIWVLSGLMVAQEIKRPTADSDAGAATWAVNACNGSRTTPSPSGALAYDAAGQATSVNYSSTGTRFASSMRSRLFYSWQTTAATYSALSLNVNASSLGFANQASGNAGTACVLYSTDSGASWRTLRCDDLGSGSGWLQQTFSVTLSPVQDLGTLRVGMCVLGAGGGGSLADAGQDNVQIFDIWTTGTTAGSVSTGSKTSGQPHRGLVIVH